MIRIAKYRKKPIIVDAEPFALGMEDGYACYSIGGEFKGYFNKHGALPRNNRKPAIKTLDGWHEVEIGKHYIVTGIKGERYPVEVEIFHELYSLVDEELENMLKNMPSDSSIFGTEQIEHLLKCLQRKTDMM